MIIDVGKMREKITIEKRDIKYVKGFKQEVWSYYYNCKAELLDLFGQEKYAAYQVKLESCIKFRTISCKRLRALIGESMKEYRLVWNKKNYDIKFVDSRGNSKTELILQVLKVS